MKRFPIALIVLLGLLLAGSAAAYMLIGKPSQVTLPDSVFTDQTLMVTVIDFQQAGDQTQQTVKDTIADIANSFGEMLGGPGVPEEILTKINEGIDRFFTALKDQKIQAIAFTMEMDFNELIRNAGEGLPPEPTMTFLVKAGQKPDMVALATAIAGEEIPAEIAAEMAKGVSFESLADGWYAIGSDNFPPMIQTPSGPGNAEVAAKFNGALGFAAGGVVQVAAVIPEDAANALAGKMAAELPEDAPESIREIVRTIPDMESAGYAIDINKGMGLRYYLAYKNADSAKRTMDGYDAMMKNLPALFEASSELAQMSEEERQLLEAMQAKMPELMELMDISQDGAVIKVEVNEANFKKMIDWYMQIISENMPGA